MIYGYFQFIINKQTNKKKQPNNVQNIEKSEKVKKQSMVFAGATKLQ